VGTTLNNNNGLRTWGRRGVFLVLFGGNNIKQQSEILYFFLVQSEEEKILLGYCSRNNIKQQ
jgi:hypothetical protein